MMCECAPLSCVLAYPSRDPINATELHETWFLPFFSVVPSYAGLLLDK
jgi:hypothetical protein